MPTNNDPPAGGGGVDADIAARPPSAAVIRFLGCDAPVAGLSTDFFTVGRTDDCDLRLPEAMGGEPSVVLRFSRGAEGWRVSPSDKLPVLINQEQVRGLAPLRSGDVIRFEPGGAGMQLTITHQNAASLASLAAKHAPRLLGERRGPQPGPAESARPRDERSDQSAPERPSVANRPPAPAAPRRVDPAILVAASIVLAGVIAGAAFVWAEDLRGWLGAPSSVDAATPASGSAANDASSQR
ncbi:MAG: FHA domain-containing protein [Planctomycetota bacterium]